MSSAMPTRRLKAAPPPPPTPKIIHLPRRPRRKTTKTASAKKPPVSSSSPAAAAQRWRRHSLAPAELHEEYYYNRGKLENLFGQEREFSRNRGLPVVVLSSGERRVAECGGGGGGAAAEAKWRFQAEMLRAECNFLRMEREFALKKLERNRAQMENTLRSAVQTLISGKKKIFEGKNVSVILEEEIEDLAEKLEELKRSSKKNREFESKNCSNFDKQACLLQRRLEKLSGLSDEKCSNRHEIDIETLSSGRKSTDDELLRRMEGLSKCMIDRIEKEYGAMISTTANSSATSSASTSKRMELPSNPSPTFSTPQLHQETMQMDENKCSGRCKAIVRRIVEQVKAETEQWSQMQEMLGQVREEMQELQASRDFWEDKALESAREIESLQCTVQEWEEKAVACEAKVNELEMQLSAAKESLESFRRKQQLIIESKSTPNSPKIALIKQVEKEKRLVISRIDDRTSGEVSPIKETQPISLAKQIEKEKRLLLRRLKENVHSKVVSGPKRLPFRDVSNASPLLRCSEKAVLRWQSP